MRPTRLARPLGTWSGLLLACGLLTVGCSGDPAPSTLGSPAPLAQPRTLTGQPDPSPAARGVRFLGTVATGLRAPWGLAFLPDGTALVGERDTTRVVAVTDGAVRPVGRVAAARPRGEAGLLGLAVSPTYARDRLVFAYVSTGSDNRVVSLRYDGTRLGVPRPVLTGIPNGFIHDGGRLLFAEDGTLFVSTGETGQPDLAQDTGSLGGKILRITPAGDPAPGNPDPTSPVWTLGHRNVQGLAFDGDGRLWATEFGQSTWDELNRIDRGRNYGWPAVEGAEDQTDYRNPFVQWRTADASPSGLAYLDGSLWAGALRGGRLWQVPLTDGVPGTPRDHLVGDYGRLRTVVAAPDGTLWVTTSNRDGRGDPRDGDDRILRVSVG